MQSRRHSSDDSLQRARYVARAVTWHAADAAQLSATGELVHCHCEPWVAELLRKWSGFATLDAIALDCLQDRRATLVAPSTAVQDPPGPVSKRFAALMAPFVADRILSEARRSTEYAHITSVLLDLARCNVLVSEEDLVEICSKAHAPTGDCRITVLGLCLPASPKQDLEQYAHSLCRGLKDADRFVELCLLHDGRSKASVNTSGVIANICRTYGQTVSDLGALARSDFLSRFEAAGVPADIVRFALHGDSNIIQRGANLNFLLLWAAGNTVLVADPTQACVAPHNRSDRLAFDKDVAEMFCAYSLSDGQTASIVDLLRDHEKLVGKSLSRIVRDFRCKDGVEFNSISRHLLETLLNNKGAVILSASGTRCGRPPNGLASFIDLAKDALESGALAHISSVDQTFLGRGSNSYALSHVQNVAYRSLSLAANALLPPFMPSDDPDHELFTCTLRVCFPDAYCGLIPWIRTDSDRNDVAMDLRRATDSTKPGFSDFAAACISTAIQDTYSCDEAARLAELGTVLTELASLPASEFCREVSFRLCEHQLSGLNDLEGLAEHLDGRTLRQSLASWAIARRKEIMKGIVNLGVAEGGNMLQASGAQRKLGAFGRLLLHWPDIVTVAKSLRFDKPPAAVGL